MRLLPWVPLEVIFAQNWSIIDKINSRWIKILKLPIYLNKNKNYNYFFLIYHHKYAKKNQLKRGKIKSSSLSVLLFPMSSLYLHRLHREWHCHIKAKSLYSQQIQSPKLIVLIYTLSHPLRQPLQNFPNLYMQIRAEFFPTKTWFPFM